MFVFLYVLDHYPNYFIYPSWCFIHSLKSFEANSLLPSNFMSILVIDRGPSFSEDGTIPHTLIL
jgi:hypothetical protein